MLSIHFFRGYAACSKVYGREVRLIVTRLNSRGGVLPIVLHKLFVQGWMVLLKLAWPFEKEFRHHREKLRRLCGAIA